MTAGFAAGAGGTCGPIRYDVEALLHTAIEDVAGHALDRDTAYRVRSIEFVRQPIFDTSDPQENNWLFRAANRYHVDTRESVLADVVLFETGSATTMRALEESERLLRRKAYLYDTRVLVNRICADGIDVVVVTRDVWTLVPHLGATRTGGDYKIEVGLTDDNVAGSGSRLSVSYFDNLDRSGIAFSYFDPNVGHRRTQLGVTILDNDDGGQQVLDVRRPFFSLDTRRSWVFRIDRNESERGLYFLDRQFVAFDSQRVALDISRGFSSGLENGFATRWSFGYRYEDHEFEQTRGPARPFEDRTLGYPWVGFERVEDEYEKSENINRIRSTEDIYLGRQYSVLIGYSDAAFGGDDKRRIVGIGNFRDGHMSDDARHLFTYGANASAYWNLAVDEVDELVVNVWARYRYRQTSRFSFQASVAGTYTDNLPTDRQVLVGGDTGLRGYPNRYQAGDRSFVVTFEQRYFSDLYLFRIIRVGAALFADAGRAWFPDTPSAEPLGVITNVGVGLRFESTRTRRDRVYHVDVAWPLQNGPGVNGVEVTLTAKRSL